MRAQICCFYIFACMIVPLHDLVVARLCVGYLFFPVLAALCYLLRSFVLLFRFVNSSEVGINRLVSSNELQLELNIQAISSMPVGSVGNVSVLSSKWVQLFNLKDGRMSLRANVGTCVPIVSSLTVCAYYDRYHVLAMKHVYFKSAPIPILDLDTSPVVLTEYISILGSV